MIAVDDPAREEKLPTMWEFGPNSDPKKKARMYGYVQGDRTSMEGFTPFSPNPDSDHGGPPEVVVQIKTTPLIDARMRYWLVRMQNQHGDGTPGYGRYQAESHNCSTFVSDALKAGGIWYNALNPDLKSDKALLPPPGADVVLLKQALMENSPEGILDWAVANQTQTFRVVFGRYESHDDFVRPALKDQRRWNRFDWGSFR